MKLIVGLGNPGPNHTKSRHNFGFVVVDRLKDETTGFCDWRTSDEFKSMMVEGRIGEEKIILVKPQTMMNLSGSAIKALAQFYKIAPEDIWVIHDDLDLPLGILRISQGSGSAGHKGVQSIIDNLGSKNFVRLRLGIHPIGQTFFVTFFKKLTSTNKFVLQRFSKSEENAIEEVIKKATQALKTAIQEGLDKAKNQFN